MAALVVSGLVTIMSVLAMSGMMLEDGAPWWFVWLPLIAFIVYSRLIYVLGSEEG